MDFRHLIVTCLFSKLRLPFDNQKVKENYAIFSQKVNQCAVNPLFLHTLIFLEYPLHSIGHIKCVDYIFSRIVVCSHQ